MNWFNAIKKLLGLGKTCQPFLISPEARKDQNLLLIKSRFSQETEEERIEAHTIISFFPKSLEPIYCADVVLYHFGSNTFILLGRQDDDDLGNLTLNVVTGSLRGKEYCQQRLGPDFTSSDFGSTLDKFKSGPG